MSDFMVSGFNNAVALFRLLRQSGNTSSTYPWAREGSVLDNTKVEKKFGQESQISVLGGNLLFQLGRFSHLAKWSLNWKMGSP